MRTYTQQVKPSEAWLGADAGEARLLALTAPPRVLHVATHGFYLPGDHAPGEAAEPMLLAGIALAGANRAIAEKEGDGILFALEAQGLNLDGSELVVLSDCDTARGTLDYAEGVYGLVRALRSRRSLKNDSARRSVLGSGQFVAFVIKPTDGSP